MSEAVKILTLFGMIFCLLTLVANFLVKRFPRLPGDVDLRLTNFNLYLPFTSSIVSTILGTILYKYFFQ